MASNSPTPTLQQATPLYSACHELCRHWFWGWAAAGTGCCNGSRIRLLCSLVAVVVVIIVVVGNRIRHTAAFVVGRSEGGAGQAKERASERGRSVGIRSFQGFVRISSLGKKRDRNFTTDGQGTTLRSPKWLAPRFSALSFLGTP